MCSRVFVHEYMHAFLFSRVFECVRRNISHMIEFWSCYVSCNLSTVGLSRKTIDVNTPCDIWRFRVDKAE